MQPVTKLTRVALETQVAAHKGSLPTLDPDESLTTFSLTIA